MPLSEIFTKSFEDYKKNFKLVLKSSLSLNLIPSMIFILILFVMALLFADTISSQIIALSSGFESSTTEPQFFEIWAFIQQAFVILMPILIVAFLLGIIVWIFSFILNIVIYYAGLKNDGKMTFSIAFRNSIGYFWKFLGYSILMLLIFLLFLIGVSLPILVTVLLWNSLPVYAGVLLILLCVAIVTLALILSIYLSICWVLTLYVIINEKKGIIESMKRSRMIVRGRWWLTFAYNLLFWLIAGTIAYIVSAFSTLLQYPLQFMALNENISMIIIFYFLNYVISYIFDFIVFITVTVYSIFFIKNIYLEFIGKNRQEAEKMVKKKIVSRKKIKTQKG